MAVVYVAGPVIRKYLKEDLESIYSFIDQVCSTFSWEVELPRSDPRLERMGSTEFASAIFDRVENADGIVTVLTEGDQSAAVEATLAASFRKPQLLLSGDPQGVPRLLKGLPWILDTVDLRDRERIGERLLQLVAPEPLSLL